MIQILCGNPDHTGRCAALASVTPGASVVSATGPALDKKVLKIQTLTFWGHGDASTFCQLSATQFINKVGEWIKWNPSIKTLEIITCNSRHGTSLSWRNENDVIEKSWVKSYTDQVKPALKRMGLTIKALPMGMGAGGANLWSVLRYNSESRTWLYVTANGAKDTDVMWPGVEKVENDENFKRSKNYVTAGAAVKARDNLRQYTLDFGTINTLRSALITLA
jgi:hypothetical protein